MIANSKGLEGILIDVYIVSGPASLIKDVRSTFCATDVTGPGVILNGGPSILLNVESFSI